MRFRLVVDGTAAGVEAEGGRLRVNGEVTNARVARRGRTYAVTVGRRRFTVRPDGAWLVVNGVRRNVAVADLQEEGAEGSRGPAGGEFVEVRPPMPGRVVSVLVAAGAAVARGQPLLILEAMKMLNEIPAPAAGVVESVAAREGTSVTAQEVVAVLRLR